VLPFSAVVLLFVRAISLSRSRFYRCPRRLVVRNTAPWDSGREGGVSSPARSIVAYETRRQGFSTSRRRDTRFSEWAEELLHPPPSPQRSRELSYVRTYLRAMRACAPSSCCASCRTRGIICGQGTTTIGTFTPHAMPGVPYTMGSSWPPAFRPPLARALRCLTSNTILLGNETGVFSSGANDGYCRQRLRLTQSHRGHSTSRAIIS